MKNEANSTSRQDVYYDHGSDRGVPRPLLNFM
jgi:hypothetical protein